MKVQITRQQLNQLIKEEVTRYNRIQELESKKQQLDEALKKLEAGENIEELWGGMKQLFNKGANAAGQAIKAGAKTAVVGAKALGQDFVDVGNQVAQGVSNATNQVKQTYQHGERIAQTSKTQKAINAAYAAKKALDAKIKGLQAQHQELTGKPYTPTRLNYKNPEALAPQSGVMQAKPAQ